MFHVLYYLCLNVKFCGMCYWHLAIEDEEDVHNKNLRSQESSGNTFVAVRYSINRMTDAIIDSCKRNKGA